MSELLEDDGVHQVIRALIEKHHAELDKLRTENAYLRKENESLWESVHELQDLINRNTEAAE